MIKKVSKQETPIQKKKRQARNLLAARRSRERRDAARKALEEANSFLSERINEQAEYIKELEERIRDLTDKAFYEGCS